MREEERDNPGSGDNPEWRKGTTPGVGITLRLGEADSEIEGGSQIRYIWSQSHSGSSRPPGPGKPPPGGHGAGSGGLPPGASVAALGGWPSTTARKEMWE